MDVIYEQGPINGAAIARILTVTKGAVSKITIKLVAFGLIRKEKRPDNKKEIYFTATPDGMELAHCHQQMHQLFDQKGLELLKTYSANELDLIAGFIEKITSLRETDMKHEL
ncbi:MarR family transcriptional regulator [Sporolactobacillus sp. CPB3-1]|uniref:MarR family transcriptional regulator n=1 Tax=Sporolactobacillus mangiferae TaxID=2940498 RepID=A0ABT0M9X7_9BACL|nr:MarR family transcriptional regulator [Sporolactobacillus mangiferae]MCL1631680.1 MarR family transcriptional regulator [Sporolactobacillus mangiferae]